MKIEPTLTEVLAARGLTHVPRDNPGFGGRKVLDSEGNVVFEGPAQECWEWLEEVA